RHQSEFAIDSHRERKRQQCLAMRYRFPPNLLQRVNTIERRLLPRKRPIRHQFGLMYRCPFRNQCASTRGQPTTEKEDTINTDDRLLLAITHMEVRGSVVIVVHGNDHSKEPAYFRHAS